MREPWQHDRDCLYVTSPDPAPCTCPAADCNAPPCRLCNGRGEIADYVGLEMKCVGVECDACHGTGRVAVTAGKTGET